MMLALTSLSSNVAERELIESCEIGRGDAVGGRNRGRRARLQTKFLLQMSGNRGRGGAGVDQERDFLMVDFAIENIVATAVALQYDFLGSSAQHRRNRLIGVVLLIEDPGEHQRQ